MLINAFPEEYRPLGLITPDGITFPRDVSTEPVEALGHTSPLAEDITSDVRGFSAAFMQVLDKGVIEASEGVDLSAATVDPTTGEVEIEIGDISDQVFYRAVILGFNGSVTAPVVRGKFFPSVWVVSFPEEQWNQSDATSLEIGFSCRTDKTLGYKVKNTITGKGFLRQAAALGWKVGATP